MSDLGPKCVRLAQNWINPRLFKDQIQLVSTFGLSDLKKLQIYLLWNQPEHQYISFILVHFGLLKSDLKEAWICPIWGESDQF